MVDDPKQGGEELEHSTPKPKGPLAAREEEVLAFWNKENIFQKSVKKPAPKGEFVFYDGPPFANGLPHYGHILASTIKDAIPRYQTMQGHSVRRQWGWDCHGLPVENLVEKELGFKNKRDIVEYGIAKFNEAARTSIMKDVSDWKRIIPRLGRWADMEHDYKTMDATYTESVWWAFKTLYDKKLIYEGFKAMHLCPRCGTTLSNFEVALGYKDIDDYAVTVKLPLVDEPGTSLLIWTTTPWTLPGNVAAAVKVDATYVKVKVGSEFVVLAKDLLAPDLVKDIVGEIKGKDLVGKRYTPPFDYFKESLHKHKTHAWKVYAAPYVTLEDGTGIVHLAPAYGAEDLELAQKEKIPLVHHVTDEGRFVAAVADFAGLMVKPKGNPKETDAKIVEFLKQKGLLFKEETIKHSYPHCWRCDTPLLNWAANSWFVKVESLKKKLLAENARVSWVPEHVGKGRFRNGLESAPDWAISRSRFWGAPLPVWRHSKSKEIKVVGSVPELLSMVRRSGNHYFVMRHGEAQSNVAHQDDTTGDPNNHLTEKGKKDALHTAAIDLKKEKIDLIVTSPFLRAKETTAIVQKELSLPDSAVMVDERLHEFSEMGQIDVRRRVGEFLFEIERRYANKNILIVSHGNPIWNLLQVAAMRSSDNFSANAMLRLAEAREVLFTPYPHNTDYELDLHRPYIDEIPLGSSVEGKWERIPDVFDCWFESGSMPYASNHYPFEKKEFNPKRFFGLSPKGYPADFIAEGLDQTRGWFYSLIVLGTALFGRSPYKHVIVNGLVLASDGQKMSKRLKNYPDPMEVVEKYGADSLRYYLLSSSVIRGEDLRFNERGVDEISKKLLMRLDNVKSFYQLYAPLNSQSEKTTLPLQGSGSFLTENSASHVLDKWIISRLGELVRDTTNGFEKYELDTATRPLADFIDDLSTWYLRRSRDRFKEDGKDKEVALSVLRYVLYTTAHVMAPVMPFFADYLYQAMRSDSDPQSVHLSNWPTAPTVDEQLLKDMKRAREVASLALEARERAGLKVRQPLSKLSVKSFPNSAELRATVANEINVKEIVENLSMEEEIELDTTLTPELKEEGIVRNLIRRVQEWRKEQGLTISDRPEHTLEVSAEGKSVALANKEKIIEETNLSSLTIVEK
jgi:isoleucyl-tRNA synthetase